MPLAEPAPRPSRRLRNLRNLALGLPLLASLVAAEGDCGFGWMTLKSPVQALTTVMVEPDGKVVAELRLISTENLREHAWIDGAELVELRVPDGSIVALEPIGEGRYRVDSEQDPDLVWMPGERYRLTFELGEDAIETELDSDDFIAVVDAPAEAIELSLDYAPAFVGDTAELSWRGDELDALIDVYGPDGERIYSTFDLSHPQFDGSKWGSLAREGAHTIPVDVFSEVGNYTLTACVVLSQEGFDAELSAALGALSGFAVGQCFEPIEFYVGE